MSRRLRLEERKLILGIEDDDIVEDEYAIQTRRIKCPLVWKTTSRGIRFQDLKEEHYEEVLNMIKDNYLPMDILCKNTELLNDEVSLQCYMQRVLGELRDCLSIIAVDENYVFQEFDKLGNPEPKIDKPYYEGKIKIVGVLVIKIMAKAELNKVFSNIQMVQGKAMQICLDIKQELNRLVDLYERMNCEAYLRFYEMCVIPEYRHKGIGFHLMDSGLYVARSLEIPVVAGIFSNNAMQKLGRRIGMELIQEIRYSEWRDDEKELIFDDPGAGNYSCVFMAGKVPPPPPPPAPIPMSPEELAKIPKVTRADKQFALRIKNEILQK